MTALLALLQSLWPALRSNWSYATLAVVSLLAWHFDTRAVANADALRAQAARFKQAQADATTLAQQALHHEQAIYAAKATEADSAYQAKLADARSGAARYIANHGLRAQAAARDASPALASTQSGGAQLPAGMPSDSVMVSANDVQACTDAVTYGLEAHAWASNINP